MQQTEPMTISDGILGAIASAIIGWLAASILKVSKSDFKDLVLRVAALEHAISDRPTRADFALAFVEIKALVLELKVETKADFKDLKNELRSTQTQT